MVAEERAALLGFLARVEGESWSVPTKARGWTVKEVVAHVVEGELEVGRLVRREIEEYRVTDASDEEGVDRWRALPGVAVRGALWQHGTAAQRLIDAPPQEGWRREIPADVRTGGLSWKGTVRLAQILRMHLFDLCLHGHDIATALGAEPWWEPRLLFMAEHTLRAGPLALEARGLPAAGALAIEVEGLAPRVLDGRSGSWRAAEGTDAATSVSIDAAGLVLAATGRSGLEEVLARAKIDGDAEAARAILESLRLF